MGIIKKENLLKLQLYPFIRIFRVLGGINLLKNLTKLMKIMPNGSIEYFYIIFYL